LMMALCNGKFTLFPFVVLGQVGEQLIFCV